MYIQENILINLHSIFHNNGLLLTVINYILKYYLLLINSDYNSESIVSYSRNSLTSSGATLWSLPKATILDNVACFSKAHLD